MRPENLGHRGCKTSLELKLADLCPFLTPTDAIGHSGSPVGKASGCALVNRLRLRFQPRRNAPAISRPQIQRLWIPALVRLIAWARARAALPRQLRSRAM